MATPAIMPVRMANGGDQRVPEAETEPVRHNPPHGLGHRHDRRAGRQQRSDGKIDVAGNDHEDQARGHYGDGNRLNRQIEDVPRCQKPPVAVRTLNTRQTTMKAPIMPRSRVSTSSAGEEVLCRHPGRFVSERRSCRPPAVVRLRKSPLPGTPERGGFQIGPVSGRA